MTSIIPAREVTLAELENKFTLEEVEDSQFFGEWQDNLPELTDVEKQMLDKVKAGYFNLLKYPPFLENPIRMAIISPLLFLADFYLHSCHIRVEKSVQLALEEDGIIVDGRIDVLVLKQQFWLTVIESKQAAYSVEAGIPQLLTYMLANPYPEKATFGLVTNGGYFLFIKLVKAEISRYATSDPFDLRRKQGNDLYPVLRILKRLGQLI